MSTFFAIQVLIWGGLLILLIVAIAKRLNEKREEDFEDRDN